MSSLSWQERGEKCRVVLQKSLKPEWLLPADQLPGPEVLDVTGFIDSCGLLTDDEIAITKLTAGELVARMAAGQLTAVATATAFLKRAHVGHQLTNLATEFMAEDALARAAELDAAFARTGKVVGPLHGVPISTKEHIGHKGRICHGAYVAFTDHVCEEDALLVQLLKKAGAVIHMRTNEPQSLMTMECSNNIYETATNPYNRSLTTGGSSGGEGAALGLRCSAIGIGTDVGGSIRAPAAFCNTFGLRPTALRNPYRGLTYAGEGAEHIRCVIGPLTNSIDDISLMQKAVLDQEPWDDETSLVPLPWKTVGPYKPSDITIGVMWDDGVVHPHPPITRGLRYAVEKLKAAGVKVVDWSPYKHDEGYALCKTLFFPDGGAAIKDLLADAGEPVNATTEWTFTYVPAAPCSLHDTWKLNAQREAYREEYHRLMKTRGVDFVLGPTHASTSNPIGTTKYWGYTAIWNVLDQPCVVFPTGLKVDPEADEPLESFVPYGTDDAREQKKYTPESFVNAPIALQLTGKHFHDEATVAAADLVSKIVQGSTVE